MRTSRIAFALMAGVAGASLSGCGEKVKPGESSMVFDGGKVTNSDTGPGKFAWPFGNWDPDQEYVHYTTQNWSFEINTTPDSTHKIFFSNGASVFGDLNIQLRFNGKHPRGSEIITRFGADSEKVDEKGDPLWQGRTMQYLTYMVIEEAKSVFSKYTDQQANGQSVKISTEILTNVRARLKKEGTDYLDVFDINASEMGISKAAAHQVQRRYEIAQEKLTQAEAAGLEKEKSSVVTAKAEAELARIAK